MGLPIGEILPRWGTAMPIRVDVLQKMFSPRVEDAVKRLASGDSYKEAARELEVDAETIKAYATTFRRAMQAKNTTEAVIKAIARGVISITEIDAKTLMACGLIALTSFSTDYVSARTIRTAKTNKSERRDDAILQSENGGEMVYTRNQIIDVRGRVSAGFFTGSVR